MIHITTDVAVVGSGTGGVSAAYHCAVAGLNTTLFEAGKGFGPALTGVNGVFAVGTAYQKSKHINESKKDIFLRLMNHANWLIDARQVTEFLNRSAGIWQWLESLGCEAEAVLAYNMDAPHTWHYFNAAKPRLEVVGKAFLDAGGTLQDGAYMNELIMEDGRVAGIKGETEKGEPIEVRCKAVVLATGEPQRIAKSGDGPSPGPAPRGDGSQKEKPYGIAMATRVGAAQHANTYSAFNMNVKPPEYDVPDVKFPGPTEQYFRQPQELMVNLKAQRFTTEEVIHAMEDGASAIASQPGGIIFSIFDKNLHEYWKQWGWSSYKYKYCGEGKPFDDFEEQWQIAKSRGYGLYDADTVEELAEQMGVDPTTLRATVDEYNAICDTGRDTQFYKDPDYLIPLRGSHYYAIKVFGVFGDAEGPLCANYKCEILNANSDPIHGLYGAGGIISNLNGRIYTHICAGSRSTFGLVSGQICGEQISAYIRSNF